MSTASEQGRADRPARPNLSMPMAEAMAFLAEETTMTIATLGMDGRPHMVAMWYVLLDGEPVFWTPAKSQKARNLRRDPRITCLVEAGDTYAALRGVEIVSEARLIDAPDEVFAVGEAIAARYSGRIPMESADDIAAQTRRRIAVAVPMTTVVSWDHRKLALHDSNRSDS